MTAPVARRESLWTGRLGVTTVGLFSLAFLFAFESYAVITALPLVADELHGVGSYAIAFAAPLATSVVATVSGGAWCDRSGPARPMLTGVGAFGAGLVVAALAPSMAWFLAGRALQGVGSGLAAVALYVLIARTYPTHLRPRAFAVLTSGWTLPSLVGPPVAGWVAHALGWRWVFGAVPLLAVVAAALLAGPLRRAGRDDGPRDGSPALPAAAVAAAAVLGISVAGQRDVDLWLVLLAVSVVALACSVPRLLPRGTWTGGRGLPSLLATRGLLSSAFFGAEAYLSLSLVRERGLDVTAAGLVVGAAAIAWFAGAWSAANASRLADRRTRVRLATLCIGAATTAALGVLVPAVPLAVVVVGWALGGFGMGLASSTISVLVLELSPEGEQGRNSAALQVNDQVTQATWLAIGSIVFAALVPVDDVAAFAVVTAASGCLAVLSLVPQSRIGRV